MVRVHLFPSRTQKLSSLAPTIVAGRLAVKIGNANINLHRNVEVFLLCYYLLSWCSFIDNNWNAYNKKGRSNDTENDFDYLHKLPLSQFNQVNDLCYSNNCLKTVMIDKYSILFA